MRDVGRERAAGQREEERLGREREGGRGQQGRGSKKD